jgi:hypothetical protein
MRAAATAMPLPSSTAHTQLTVLHPSATLTPAHTHLRIYGQVLQYAVLRSDAAVRGDAANRRLSLQVPCLYVCAAKAMKKSMRLHLLTDIHGLEWEACNKSS